MKWKEGYTLASVWITSEDKGAIEKEQHVDWQYCFELKRTRRQAHLLWVANTLLACPRPLQPGRGQWGSSCLLAFQAKGSPLMDDSFCLLAASGQLPALRWDVYFPDIWPCPSHPITGHLREQQTCCWRANTTDSRRQNLSNLHLITTTPPHTHTIDKTKTFNCSKNNNHIIKKKNSLSTTGPEDLLTIKLINPTKCWLKIKSAKLGLIALTVSY